MLAPPQRRSGSLRRLPGLLAALALCAAQRAVTLRAEDEDSEGIGRRIGSGRPAEPPPINASSGSNERSIHVIGDTHGDRNFLVRSLLSTMRFELRGKDRSNRISWDIRWKENPSQHDDEDWSVVILGDLIDRGTHSLENLKLVRKLTKHRRWGKRLVVVMGNHEDMLLRFNFRYAGKGFSAQARYDLFRAEGEEPDAKLRRWMTRLPVVLAMDGVLLMHAGMEKWVAEEFLSDTSFGECMQKSPREHCVLDMLGNLNNDARRNLKETRKCVLKHCTGPEVSKPSHDKCGSPCRALQPEWLKSLLWYRGFSRQLDGAGNYSSCKKAENVAHKLGVHTFVLAHTTHKAITSYCMDTVPIYVTDTHRSDCVENDECDFDPAKRFHHYRIDHHARNVPQSLLLAHRDGVEYASKCFAEIHQNRELMVECAPVE